VALLVPISLRMRGDELLTVNAEQYTAMLETFLWNKLNLRQLNSLWFWQDRAIANQHRFPWQFSGRCFQADSFVPATSTGHLLTWSFSTRLLSLGLRQKQNVQDMSCQYWWLETANSGVHSRNTSWNPMCYGNYAVSTAGVCWTKRSPWWCHIQTVTLKRSSQWKWIYLC
jgi:hypothetical protein